MPIPPAPTPQTSKHTVPLHRLPPAGAKSCCARVPAEPHRLTPPALSWGAWWWRGQTATSVSTTPLCGGERAHKSANSAAPASRVPRAPRHNHRRWPAQMQPRACSSGAAPQQALSAASPPTHTVTAQPAISYGGCQTRLALQIMHSPLHIAKLEAGPQAWWEAERIRSVVCVSQTKFRCRARAGASDGGGCGNGPSPM